MIPLMQAVHCSQIHRKGKQNGGCQRLGGEGNGELLFNGYKVSVMQVENILEIDCTTT